MPTLTEKQHTTTKPKQPQHANKWTNRHMIFFFCIKWSKTSHNFNLQVLRTNVLQRNWQNRCIMLMPNNNITVCNPPVMHRVICMICNAVNWPQLSVSLGLPLICFVHGIVMVTCQAQTMQNKWHTPRKTHQRSISMVSIDNRWFKPFFFCARTSCHGMNPNVQIDSHDLINAEWTGHLNCCLWLSVSSKHSGPCHRFIDLRDLSMMLASGAMPKVWALVLQSLTSQGSWCLWLEQCLQKANSGAHS